MCRACPSTAAGVVVAIATAAALVCAPMRSAAQQPAGTLPPVAMNFMAAADATAARLPVDPYSAAPVVQRGPLARLVTNPDHSGGLPPYALTDQNGSIQRYVEPVPGIDLTPFVGQVVTVRHDTGRTLLASQLELPPQPLHPMLGDAGDVGALRPVTHPAGEQQQPGNSVRLAQYADNDDATVELLDEDEEMPLGAEATTAEAIPDAMMDPPGEYPAFSGPTISEGGPEFGPSFVSPSCGPTGAEHLADEYGMVPCPRCGRYHDIRKFEDGGGYGSAFGAEGGRPTQLSADIEINFLRLHVAEDGVGKVSEKYEFSPRFILGFTGLGPLDGRVRYWIYGRETRTLNGDRDTIRLELDVLDVEATHHFAGRRSEVVLAGGFRLAGLELVDGDRGGDDLAAGADLVGITLAADGQTRLAALDAGRLAWVYGGRLSILGGDWGGEDDHDLVQERTRDDNVVVHELYAGVEFARCYRQLDLRARLAFEMQNWHSDVLSAQSNVDSFGILGPGIRIGAQF
jgi:hypothetical protein